jgi:hypothetical protein
MPRNAIPAIWQVGGIGSSLSVVVLAKSVQRTQHYGVIPVNDGGQVRSPTAESCFKKANFWQLYGLCGPEGSVPAKRKQRSSWGDPRQGYRLFAARLWFKSQKTCDSQHEKCCTFQPFARKLNQGLAAQQVDKCSGGRKPPGMPGVLFRLEPVPCVPGVRHAPIARSLRRPSRDLKCARSPGHGLSVK